VSISNITAKKNILKVADFSYEFLSRELYKSKIYFPYKIQLPHPLYTFWKGNPPCNYCNAYRAKLFHFVNSVPPKYDDKQYILEIIDHPLSILSKYISGDFTHDKYINNVEKAQNMYCMSNMKKLLIPFEGQREFIKYYFGEDINKKVKVIHQPLENNIKNNIKKASKELNFLNISSDFEAKGTSLILDAWKNFQDSFNNAYLTLICHNIPKEYEDNLPKNVKLIKKLPLSDSDKNYLFKDADIFIANTLTDGGGAQEALSFGKPLVMFRIYSAMDLLKNNNGILINVPLNIYDVKHYGKTWKSHNEFISYIEEYRESGKFDRTINDLSDSFRKYENNRSLVEEHRRNSVELFNKEFTLKNRNKKIISIYREIEESIT
jgi:glycosyltransferase involved in cell wall biosynthesis